MGTKKHGSGLQQVLENSKTSHYNCSIRHLIEITVEYSTYPLWKKTIRNYSENHYLNY